MAEILGEWKFPDHGKVNPDTNVAERIVAIDQWEHGENVKVIPVSNMEWEIVLAEIDNFTNRVNVIIENIVHDAIQTYLNYRAETPLEPALALVNDTRNLVAETLSAQRDMMIRAEAMQDAFLYMGDTVDIDHFDLDDNYVFDMVYNVLASYQEYISSLLVQNEQLAKKRLVGPKRFRQRQNSKKRR